MVPFNPLDWFRGSGAQAKCRTALSGCASLEEATKDVTNQLGAEKGDEARDGAAGWWGCVEAVHVEAAAHACHDHRKIIIFGTFGTAAGNCQEPAACDTGVAGPRRSTSSLASSSTTAR